MYDELLKINLGLKSEDCFERRFDDWVWSDAVTLTCLGLLSAVGQAYVGPLFNFQGFERIHKTI